MLSSLLPGCMGVIYDAAFRGVHRADLARLGRLVLGVTAGDVPHGPDRMTLCQ